MNKFRKLFLSLIIMFVCILGFVFSVNAEETNNTLINLDTIRLEVEGVSDANQQDAYIRIYDSGFDDEVTYVATFTKDTDSVKTQLAITDDSVVLSDLKLEDDTIVKNAYFKSVVYLPVAEKYGDIYVTFYTPDSGNIGGYKKISDPILVKKPENLKISKRFRVYAWEDQTTIYYYNLGSIGTKRSANYKIGVVNDNTILKQIKEGNYAGLESLLTFAKNDKNNILSGKIEVKSDQPTLYKQTDLIEGAYYYIYLDLDTEEGTYYRLDDVNLYQCRKTIDNELWLVDVDDSKFEWNIEETEWDRFVKEYKKTELVKSYENSTDTVTINSTSNSLLVQFTQGDNSSAANFVYENGVLKYKPYSIAIDMEITHKDVAWIINAIYALSELKGYDVEEVLEWLKSSKGNTLTIEKDGIVFVSENYDYNVPITDLLDTTIPITSFELNIENGLKKFNEEKEPEEEIEDSDEPDAAITQYKFISGENQKHKINETKELKFEIDAEYDLFESVLVNGKLIDSSSYIVSEGSTIVVLKQKYLDTLNNGVHTLRVNFKDGGYAETKFTVEKTVKNPSTGIGITGGILVLGFILMGIYFVMKRHTKFPKHN